MTPTELLILDIYKLCREVTTGRTPKTSIQVLQEVEKRIETAVKQWAEVVLERTNDANV